jgi:hypothetical protein
MLKTAKKFNFKPRELSWNVHFFLPKGQKLARVRSVSLALGDAAIWPDADASEEAEPVRWAMGTGFDAWVGTGGAGGGMELLLEVELEPFCCTIGLVPLWEFESPDVAFGAVWVDGLGSDDVLGVCGEGVVSFERGEVELEDCVEEADAADVSEVANLAGASWEETEVPLGDCLGVPPGFLGRTGGAPPFWVGKPGMLVLGIIETGLLGTKGAPLAFPFGFCAGGTAPHFLAGGGASEGRRGSGRAPVGEKKRMSARFCWAKRAVQKIQRFCNKSENKSRKSNRGIKSYRFAVMNQPQILRLGFRRAKQFLKHERSQKADCQTQAVENTKYSQNE